MKTLTTLLLAAALFAAAGCDSKPPAPPPSNPMPTTSGGGTAAKGTDPICGMAVADDAPLSAKEGDKTYHFCSQHCLDAFKADPKKYAK